MAITKQCGWRRKNGQNSSPLYIAGSGRAVLARGVHFQEFESVVAKLRHLFMALPGGRGLLVTDY
jgi:hypothetical protein